MIIRNLGRQAYIDTWQAMKTFTLSRTDTTADEIWLLEHDSIFTQGQNGSPEHLLTVTDIPVIQTDRGGQITWHGPGQLIVYILVDIRRLKCTVRSMVCAIERAVIQLLAEYGLKAESRRDAPGVYIDGKKICSLGLRIKRGCSYHGLALNLNPDLTPFKHINPCGFPALEITRLCDLVDVFHRQDLETRLADLLIAELSYNDTLEIKRE